MLNLLVSLSVLSAVALADGSSAQATGSGSGDSQNTGSAKLPSGVLVVGTATGSNAADISGLLKSTGLFASASGLLASYSSNEDADASSFVAAGQSAASSLDSKSGTTQSGGSGNGSSDSSGQGSMLMASGASSSKSKSDGPGRPQFHPALVGSVAVVGGMGLLLL